MNKSSNRRNLAKTLAPVFACYPQIRAVYLFGSTAAGTNHPQSDLDLALVPRSKALRRQKTDILTDLTRAGFDRIDLVILDQPDLVLNYEAVRLNCLLYHTADFEPGTFFSDTIRKYLDFLPYLTVQRQAYKRRILNGEA